MPKISVGSARGRRRIRDWRSCSTRSAGPQQLTLGVGLANAIDSVGAAHGRLFEIDRQDPWSYQR
jgi:hypothetical protein